MWLIRFSSPKWFCLYLFLLCLYVTDNSQKNLYKLHKIWWHFTFASTQETNEEKYEYMAETFCLIWCIHYGRELNKNSFSFSLCLFSVFFVVSEMIFILTFFSLNLIFLIKSMMIIVYFFVNIYSTHELNPNDLSSSLHNLHL